LYPLRRNLRSLHRRRLWEQLDNLKSQASNLGLLTLVSPSSYDPAVAAAAARFCFDRRKTIDAIIVSGDLATNRQADRSDSGKVIYRRSRDFRPVYQLDFPNAGCDGTEDIFLAGKITTCIKMMVAGPAHLISILCSNSICQIGTALLAGGRERREARGKN
jgi:hypothetical protein